ncbi:TetR/AcrR family transcriptional regulator [Paenibacillus monticola]|uniref:TetR family transcriptional regulator n=1 Tax=Paenibacillus monticola TaxID=2666075 RepID=A0A7X2H503_9BACL|nr:TetR/AcrR family transcriptional regulator [Paenibacillus monticola]MRN53637.1 TetR family transcriptional regulator [Paenibacillus monticola]
MARSKEFDIDTVLGKAMTIFWQQGYEKTSMQDLVSGMGIHKRSMYDTFGDKHTLYMKVMERYTEIISAKMEERVQGLPSAKGAIRLLFETTVHKDDAEPKGCLFVNTAVELSNHDPIAVAKVNQSFMSNERLLEQLVQHGQENGEISGQYSPLVLSFYLHNALVGLRVMVKTTSDLQKLDGIIDTTLAILD